MRRILKTVAIPALMLIVGLVAGAALGQRQGLGMGMKFLESLEEFSVAMHVEVASCIRVGDTDRALTLLDSMIDAAVTNAHAQPAPHRVLRSMSDAKVYRRAVPAQGPNAAAVVAALANVPEPDGLPSGLKRLAAQSGK